MILMTDTVKKGCMGLVHTERGTRASQPDVVDKYGFAWIHVRNGGPGSAVTAAAATQYFR